MPLNHLCLLLHSNLHRKLAEFSIFLKFLCICLYADAVGGPSQLFQSLANYLQTAIYLQSTWIRVVFFYYFDFWNVSVGQHSKWSFRICLHHYPRRFSVARHTCLSNITIMYSSLKIRKLLKEMPTLEKRTAYDINPIKLRYKGLSFLDKLTSFRVNTW